MNNTNKKIKFRDLPYYKMKELCERLKKGKYKWCWDCYKNDYKQYELCRMVFCLIS